MHKTIVAIYEEDILMGNIYYGKECKDCKKKFDTGPGLLDLGAYK